MHVEEKLLEIGNMSVTLAPMSPLHISTVLSSYYNRAFDAALLQYIHETTHGVPLDAIDMAYELFESGAIEDGPGGAAVLKAGTDPEKLASTAYQDMLVARFSRLSNDAKCCIWVACAIGMQCPSALLRPVLRKMISPDSSEEKVTAILETVVAKRFLSAEDSIYSVDNSNYANAMGYTHVSYDGMNALYNTIVPERRKKIHSLVYEHLVSTSSLTGDTLYLLGYHASRAQLADIALRCFHESKVLAFAHHDHQLAQKCLESSARLSCKVPFVNAVWALERGICEHLVSQEGECDSSDAMRHVKSAVAIFKQELRKVDVRGLWGRTGLYLKVRAANRADIFNVNKLVAKVLATRTRGDLKIDKRKMMLNDFGSSNWRIFNAMKTSRLGAKKRRVCFCAPVVQGRIHVECVVCCICSLHHRLEHRRKGIYWASVRKAMRKILAKAKRKSDRAKAKYRRSVERATEKRANVKHLIGMNETYARIAS